MTRLAGLLAIVTVPIWAQERAPANDTINRSALEAQLTFLASDLMGGRLTGTETNHITGEFINAQFGRLGLKPLGSAGGNFFHQYDLVYSRLGSNNKLRITNQADEREYHGEMRQDFYPFFFSPSGRASGDVVFAGFGISAPALKWNDYAENDVRGKIVLVLDGDPGADDPKSPFDGVVRSEYGTALAKVKWAQEKGASAVLIVNHRQGQPGSGNFSSAARGYWADPPPRIERYVLARWADELLIPAAQISPALAERILAGTGTLQKLAEASESPGGFLKAANVRPGRLELQTDLQRTTLPDRNVIGYIEGTDPRLKEEAVIVAAHFDHNGAEGDQIYNGADDNGTGTVALLEIAEAYAIAARSGKRPRRSVLFAAWNSEERCCGPLLGAWAWVEKPLWPLEKTVAVLNMDMIGRNEEVRPGGGARFTGLKLQTAESNENAVNTIGYTFSPELSAAIDRANSAIDLTLRKRYDNNASNLLRRSDHWPFLQRGVPAIWFHTGLHPDYHTIYDRPEKINYEKMERVARLVHQLSWNLAQQDSRPRMVSPRPTPPLD